MKRKKMLLLSLLCLLTAVLALSFVPACIQHSRTAALQNAIIDEQSLWQTILEGENPSDLSPAADFLSRHQGLILDAKWLPEYEGMYLVTQTSLLGIRNQDGILITTRSFPPQPKEKQTGTMLEPLEIPSTLHLYRLIHYWD